MKKFCNFVCFFMVVVMLFTSCENRQNNTNQNENKGTNDAIHYYSTKLNSAKKMQTNNRELSISIKKGDICKYGIVEKVGKDLLAGNIWEDIKDSFGSLFGVNDKGFYVVVKTEEINDCIMWKDWWTNSINSGSVQITEISQESITESVTTSVSACIGNEDKASIKAEKAVNSTKTWVNQQGVERTLNYNFENYDIDNYKYAWAITADVTVYYTYYYKLDFWDSLASFKDKYDYVGTTCEIVVNENEPDFNARLIYISANE